MPVSLNLLIHQLLHQNDQVWDYYLANDIETIRNYCETDALNTYLVYLRYQLIRGKLNDNLYLDECEKVKEMLLNESKMHLKKFLKVWQKDN